MVESFCCRPDSGDRKGVHHMDVLLSFILSVLASVVAFYLCKWLSGKD